MEPITERGREEAPGPPAASSEDVGGWAERGSGLRKASEIVAVVCTGVLAGGGAGMLGGVALGAINPFFLGMVGIAAGAVASVPLGWAILKRPEGGTGSPAGLVPQNPPDVPGGAQAAAEAPEAGGKRGTWWWRRRLLGLVLFTVRSLE